MQSPTTSTHIDFNTFILSLASSAMMHMGIVPDPSGRQADVNLEMARQTIDMLIMLRGKTQGNLDPTEATMLERVLHDVRVGYLEATKKHAS